MYIDKVTITCKAGNGGDGVVSWRREKYVPKGGPDGGDGGQGGNIYFEVKEDMNTLLSFKYQKKFFAEDGVNGDQCNRIGKSGNDLIIQVPPGTIIKDYETNLVVADMYESGSKVLIFKGGRGGRGNARFATPTRRSPSFSELGEKTQAVRLVLELKTIADVGLIGFPNVGKSTLLSVISRAKPEIASYPFTTLSPILGVVKYYDDSFIVADIPGLIEGASSGLGLGHEFLRHIERVRLLIHVVDISEQDGRSAIEDYYTIRKELKLYSNKLDKLKEIVVLNKIDLLETDKKVEEFKKIISGDIFVISAATKLGIKELIDKVALELSRIPKVKPLNVEPFVYDNKVDNSYEIQIVDGEYNIIGGLVESLSRRVVLSDDESFRWFQKMLRINGVIEKLKECGIKEGDIVNIKDISFEFID